MNGLIINFMFWTSQTVLQFADAKTAMETNYYDKRYSSCLDTFSYLITGREYHILTEIVLYKYMFLYIAHFPSLSPHKKSVKF